MSIEYVRKNMSIAQKCYEEYMTQKITQRNDDTRNYVTRNMLIHGTVQIHLEIKR